MGALANFVAFQATWFVAVIGAGRGLAWPGVLAVAVFAALQLRDAGMRGSDLRLALAAGVGGFALESLFVASGLLRYAAPWPSPALAPAWIVALWIALAFSVNHSLRWLQPWPWLAGVLGVCAAPLSYLGAARGWQAVAFAEPVPRTLAIVSACWGGAMWALVAMARRGARSVPATPSEQPA